MERVWFSRLRWRMRGAWMWPAFATLTFLDGIMISARPIAGDRTDLAGALLLAAFFNLVVVAVLAPLAGTLLRRRRGDLPRLVAHDYSGTALLVAVTLALAAAGLAHRPAVLERQRDAGAQAVAVHDYVLAQASSAYRANLARADTRRIESDLYRTCVPGPDPRRSLCLFVNTDQSPPGVRVDPNHETNQSLAGPRFSSPGG